MAAIHGALDGGPHVACRSLLLPKFKFKNLITLCVVSLEFWNFSCVLEFVLAFSLAFLIGIQNVH